MSSTTSTGFRSIVYRSGFVYNWVTKRLFDQAKKFSSISHLIGKNKKVLDLPCGTGFLARYLHPSISYHGWDLNHRFLAKLKLDWDKGRLRPKKIKIEQKDIFDFDNYPDEKFDVIVFSDILHHIYPRHLSLIENAKRYARRIISCEPVSIQPDKVKGHDFVAKLFLFFTKKIPQKLHKILDFFLADNDGINSFNNRSKWEYDAVGIKDFYQENGFCRTYDLENECIAIWDENN